MNAHTNGHVCLNTRISAHNGLDASGESVSAREPFLRHFWHRLDGHSALGCSCPVQNLLFWVVSGTGWGHMQCPCLRSAVVQGKQLSTTCTSAHSDAWQDRAFAAQPWQAQQLSTSPAALRPAGTEVHLAAMQPLIRCQPRPAAIQCPHKSHRSLCPPLQLHQTLCCCTAACGLGAADRLLVRSKLDEETHITHNTLAKASCTSSRYRQPLIPSPSSCSGLLLQGCSWPLPRMSLHCNGCQA